MVECSVFIFSGSDVGKYFLCPETSERGGNKNKVSERLPLLFY